MKRYASFFILIMLIAVTGCAPAKSYYAGIAEQRRDEARTYYTQGLELAAGGMHYPAIEQFKKAVEADRYLSDAYLAMSKSYYAIGNYDFATFYNIKYGEYEKFRDVLYNFNLYTLEDIQNREKR